MTGTEGSEGLRVNAYARRGKAANPPNPPSVRVRKARSTSRCPACGAWLRPGARIARIDRRGWICMPCAIAARLAANHITGEEP